MKLEKKLDPTKKDKKDFDSSWSEIFVLHLVFFF